MPAVMKKVDKEKSVECLGICRDHSEEAYPPLVEMEGFHLEALAITVEINDSKCCFPKPVKKMAYHQHQCLNAIR